MSETILGDIGSYKDKLISAFLNSNDICQLLSDNGTAESTADHLLYTQLFPYLYTDETQTAVLPYLCMEIEIPELTSGTIKNMNLILWIYCHKDCMNYAKTGYSGTRVDILADLTERCLRNTDRLGIGRFSLNSVTYLTNLSNSYYGKQLVFTIPDFKVKRM